MTISPLLIALIAFPAESAQKVDFTSLSSETSRLVNRINSFEKQLALHLERFGAEGKSPASAAPEAAALSLQSEELIKSWKALLSQKTLSSEQRAQAGSLRDWLTGLKTGALGERWKARSAMEKAARTCDAGAMDAALSVLLPQDARAPARAGWLTPCRLKARRDFAKTELTKQLLLGGQQKLSAAEPPSLIPHENPAAAEPLARFWRAVYERGIDAFTPGEFEVLRGYSSSPYAQAAAIPELLALWSRKSPSDLSLLEAAALETVAEFERLNSDAPAQNALAPRAAARQAISRVLNAAGFPGNPSNRDAEKLLSSGRTALPTQSLPERPLRSVIERIHGPGTAPSVSEEGFVNFLKPGSSIRVAADPLDFTFTLCQLPCGAGDSLDSDGRPAAKPLRFFISELKK